MFFFREKLCFDVFGSKGVQNVSDFLHEVLTTCSLKTDLNCLLGKSLVLRYLGQRDKNQIKFLRQINTQNIADFLHKVTVVYRLEIDLIYLLVENLVLRFYSQT